MSVLRPLLAKMSRNCRNELKTVKMPENICGSQFESLNAPCFALMDQRPRFFDQCNIVLSKIIRNINGIFTIHTRHTILKRMKCDIVLSKTTQANLQLQGGEREMYHLQIRLVQNCGRPSLDHRQIYSDLQPCSPTPQHPSQLTKIIVHNKSQIWLLPLHTF